MRPPRFSFSISRAPLGIDILVLTFMACAIAIHKLRVVLLSIHRAFLLLFNKFEWLRRLLNLLPWIIQDHFQWYLLETGTLPNFLQADSRTISNPKKRMHASICRRIWRSWSGLWVGASCSQSKPVATLDPTPESNSDLFIWHFII